MFTTYTAPLRRLSIPVLLAAVVAGAAAIPLEEVSLYTSGVGEFVHRGEVEGSGTLTISVPAGSMSDVLRSLTVVDHDGGAVSAVGFPTGEDAATRLGRFPLDLFDTHRLYHVLRQLRGTSVEIVVSLPGEFSTSEEDLTLSGPHRATVSGVLLGAEENSLLIARNEGIREVPIWQVEDVRLADASAREELATALQALADAALESGQRELVIEYQGTGVRTLEVRYLQEMPRWHTTYRTVIGAGSERALFQGWAHLDNTTSVDWESVQLTLVSAQPVTYRFDLYEPQYVTRPPFVPDDASDPFTPSPRTVPEALLHRRTAQDSVADSVAPEIARDELITGMTFTLPQPVSIAPGRSSIVPLINRTIPAETTRFFDPRRDGTRPRAAILLTNDGSELLPAGPVTVFEGARYVGDGAITTILPGAQAVVTYARDADLRITSTGDTGREELITVRIADGILVTEHRTRHTTTYSVESSTGTTPGRGGAPSLLISHPRRRGWELVSPADADVRAETAVIDVAGTVVTVREERMRSQRYSLVDVDDDLLAMFSANRLIDPTVRRTLQNISTLRSALAEHRRTRRELEERRDRIFADQERISTNMSQLDRDSTLYRRYSSELARQEDELRALRQDLDAALREERRAESALREYLRTLGAE